MLDERSGVQYAQMLTEKGYENTFLLSGGIEAFLEDNADLVEGVAVPTPKSPFLAWLPQDAFFSDAAQLSQ